MLAQNSEYTANREINSQGKSLFLFIV